MASNRLTGEEKMDGQCLGKTKSGKRCRNTGSFKNGYCRLHAHQAPPAKEPDSNAAPETGNKDSSHELRSECSCDPRHCLVVMAIIAIVLLVIYLALRRRK